MADAKFEEVIRLAFETGGTEGIKQAAGIMANLGDVSEATRAQAASLLDTISQAEKTERAVEQYRQLGLGVVDYQRQITAAKAKVVELAEALKQADAPSKAQQRELEKARGSVSSLVAAQQKQLGQLRELKGSIEGQGISLRSVGSAQQQVAARTAEASAALRTMATRLRDERASEQAFQSELAAATAKTRAETAQYDAALKRVQRQLEENGRAAKEGNAEAVEGLERTRGVLERLREPLIALGAFFSFEGLKEGLKSIFETGDQFEKFHDQLNGLYGSAEKGKQAFDWVNEFTTHTPYKLDEVMGAFVRLQKFGIDPTNGSLQAVVDQAAKLGGGAEQLDAITTALTKAATKGQLDLRGLIQLTEAGVPVFDMLAAATGKTTAEIRNLAQQGLLGADAVQALLDQMGKQSAGAATEQLEQLGNQWIKFTENVDDFKNRIAEGGVFDYFRDQLKALNAKIAALAADGTLDAYAKRIAAGIVKVADAVKSAVTFIAEHAAAIGELAKAYAAFKIGGIIMELGGFVARLVTVARGAIAGASAVEGLSGAMLAFRTAVVLLSGPIGWVIGGLSLFAVGAKKAADAITEYALKHGESGKKLEESEARQKKAAHDFAEMHRQKADALQEFAKVELQSQAQVEAMTADERREYEKRLAQHAEYVKQRKAQHAMEQMAGEGGEEAKKQVEELAAEAELTKAALETFKGASKNVADAAAANMSVGALKITQSLLDVNKSTDETRQALAGAFADASKKSAKDLADLGIAMAAVTQQSGAAGREMRAGFRDQLGQMASEDLLRFQDASKLAFVQFGTDAKGAAEVSRATLETALGRLGVSAEKWGGGITDAGQSVVAAFNVVAQNGQATSATVEAAFNAALSKTTTAADAQAIGAAMEAAGKKGEVGFGAVQRAIKSVQDRVTTLQNAVDPLADSFAELGIKSQRALDAAAARAKHAFENIVEGARNGQASVNDVRAAFGKYAQAQLDQVANDEEWKRASVRNSLEVQAATFNVSDEMAKLGAAGTDTGSKIASGANTATEALHGTAAAAREAASASSEAAGSAQKFGSAAARAGGDANAAQRAFNPAAVALNGLSAAMMKAYADLNRLAGTPFWVDNFNKITFEWRRQNDELNKQLIALNQQNAAYDEMAQRVETLRKQFGYLNDGQLGTLAQAQKTLEDNKRRAKEEADRKIRERLQEQADRSKADTERWNKELGIDTAPASSAAAPAKRIAIDLNVASSTAPGAVPAQLAANDVQKIANEVVRQLGIARASSNR